MAVEHMVRRGDNLWGLASQYLGNGARWPEIQKLHNQEVARRGKRGRLFPIEDENLIYVGQTVFVPSRQKVPDPEPDPDNGKKAKGRKPAVPVNLAINYAIGRDTPPVMHARTYGDYTIKTEMSGKIDIEMASSDRYRHSLELLMAKNLHETRQKLYHDYDPALSALTAKPEMVYDASTGKVRIDAPIAAQANAGPYTFDVHAHAPNHMSGSVKPSPLSGKLNVFNRDYKYNAVIELRADVIWHPRPNAKPESVTRTVKETALQRESIVREAPIGHTTKWDQVVNEKGVFMAVVLVVAVTAGSILYRIATRGGLQPAPLMSPFTHTIDQHNPPRA